MSTSVDGPVPPSLTRADRPDRFFSAYRLLLRGYAGIVTRSKVVGPRPVDRDLAVVVADVRHEADGVVRVKLVASEENWLPQWHPGAHIDVVLPSGRLRQYSLCGDPEDRQSYRIAVRRIAAGAGGSIEINDQLTVGQRLIARGPRNGFPFAYPHLARADISGVAFIAAGIGITAILPMVRAAAAAGVDWRLTYVGRDDASMAFVGELHQLDLARVRIHTGARLSTSELLGDTGPRTSVYFCGPPEMLDSLRAAVGQRETAGFHFERFSPPAVVGGVAFALRLARSGQRVEVAADQSALNAVRERVPGVAYSCQQGFCGTCRVSVLGGRVDRRGQARFLDGPGTMLLCTDRAIDDEVTIDL